MKLAWKQKDGSVFLGKCTAWFSFGEHTVVHTDEPLEDGEHLVICKKCSGRGYALNRSEP